MFYYQYVTGEMLEGSEELMRLHHDYPPQATRREALDACRDFLEKERAYHQGIADNRAKRLREIQEA